MRRVIAVLTFVVALVVMPLAAPANATEGPQGWYTWSTTLAPGVTDPKGDGDVTWPQPLVGKGQIAPACGQWVQQDLYGGSNEAIEEVVGDGVLTRTNGQPEDHAIIKDWKFVYGGACPVTPGEPEWSITTKCEANAATLLLADQPAVGWTVNDEPTGAGSHTYTTSGTYVVTAHPALKDVDLTGTLSWTFTLVPSQPCATPTPTPTTTKEPTPSTSTPTHTPTSKPSATPSPSQPAPHKPRPTTEPSPTSTTSIPPSEPSSPSTPAPQPRHVTPPLAETGSEAGAVAGLAGLISVTGALLLWAARKRKAHETA